ncbi:hypothetical protein DET57_114168 [Klebsiella oxytoca]|uniref:Uncharacterized protein n=1 Tax=Klebsiella oxytoca TaxID=571 RepID=A0A318FHJ8_KLEOX|nr:hypothetical protein [Klebsiella oxytoca]PXW42176.1 hypothetical protein DET57_114168 [Klebsiella oxytoca]
MSVADFYTEKLIDVEFKLDDQKDPIRLSGYRVEMTMQNAGGRSGSSLDLAIYNINMDLAQRIAGTNGWSTKFRQDWVSILAGDQNHKDLIFQGNTYEAFIDFNNMPDVPLRLRANAAYYYRVLTAAPNSYKGPVDAVEMIESITKFIGYNFVNNGVKPVILTDMYAFGSAINQICEIADAARIGLTIHNKEIQISPNGEIQTDIITEVSPSTGMLGYPTVTSRGVLINHIFLPYLKRQGLIRLVTDNKSASGVLKVTAIEHNIASKVQGGPWVTSIMAIKQSE